MKIANRSQFIFSFIVIAFGMALPKALSYMRISFVLLVALTPVLLFIFLLGAIYIYRKITNSRS